MVTDHCIDYLLSSFSLLHGASTYDRVGVKAHKDYIEGMISMARVANIITLDMEAELKDRLEHEAEARIKELKKEGQDKLAQRPDASVAYGNS